MKQALEYIGLDKQGEVELKSNFVRASNNKNFENLLKTISVPVEVAMKYTSQLELAAKELEHCQNCKHIESCKNEQCGYRLTAKKDTEKSILFEYIACKKLQEKLKKEAYLENIELFESTKAVKEAKISEIKTDDKERLQIIRYFKTFLEEYEEKKHPKGLYLHGSFGTGKTYLISALFNELAKRNIRCAICYYPEFLRSLKESFDTDYKEKFRYIKKVPILLLDDIGAEVVSPWARDEILGSILQYRMEENLPTFFTSNLNLKELEEHLATSNRGIENLKARRILERIEYMTVSMQLIGKNRRN